MYKIIATLLAIVPAVAATGDIVCSNQIVDFYVIETSASPPIFTKLTRTVDLSDFSRCALNIEATVKKTPSHCNKLTTKCVKFFLNDVEVHQERFAPYTIYGNEGDNFYARKPPLGTHTLKACTYSDEACTRNKSGCKETRVKFLGCGRPTVAPTPIGSIGTPIQSTPPPTENPSSSPIPTIERTSDHPTQANNYSDEPSLLPNASPIPTSVSTKYDIPTSPPLTTIFPIPSTTAPVTTLPTGAPDMAQTESPVLIIRVENFYLAYVAPKAIEPTKEQYALLVEATNDFFTDTLRKRFANHPKISFIRAESSLGFSLFNASIPAKRFNIYTDYDFTDLIYTTNSTPPDAAASFVLLRDSINRAYITDYVRSLKDTPFVTTNEVVFRSSSKN